jgi:nitrite reductase/ring-hydroxylating ferredoxin subunit
MKKLKLFLGIGLFLAIMLPILAACSSAATAAGGNPGAAAAGGKNLNATVKQTTIKATISGDTVTIPVSDVDKYGNVNFRVNTASDYYMFMAYQYGDQTYVRADVCVPCGSESFTLKNGTLVCNSCGTVFDAKTGAGISGVTACQRYTKQPVPYQVTGDNIVMKWSDMATAYQKTTTPVK